MSEPVWTCAVCGKTGKISSRDWIVAIDIYGETHIPLCSKKCRDVFRRQLDKKFPQGRIEHATEEN